jgi:DNA invertase Pin-like site-specific DNA recombinase
MVSGRIRPIEADLFSTASPREAPSPAAVPPPKAASTTDAATAASAPRYLLPKDLTSAISHLSDQEFDRLLAAVLAELKRRGKMLPVSRKTSRKSSIKEIGPPLTLAKLNAVRAAFKAGIAPSRIARQFGISHADIRKALASGTSKRAPDRS